jgi:probable phosphoglycerate mutase
VEIDLGAWSGLTREEVEAKWPRPLAGASRYDWYFRSPNGERSPAATSRLGRWLDEAERAGEVTIAISHRVASRILRGLYAKLPIAKALTLEVSRDAIFTLGDGLIEKIPCI